MSVRIDRLSRCFLRRLIAVFLRTRIAAPCVCKCVCLRHLTQFHTTRDQRLDAAREYHAFCFAGWPTGFSCFTRRCVGACRCWCRCRVRPTVVRSEPRVCVRYIIRKSRLADLRRRSRAPSPPPLLFLLCRACCSRAQFFCTLTIRRGARVCEFLACARRSRAYPVLRACVRAFIYALLLVGKQTRTA